MRFLRSGSSSRSVRMAPRGGAGRTRKPDVRRYRASGGATAGGGVALGATWCRAPLGMSALFLPRRPTVERRLASGLRFRSWPLGALRERERSKSRAQASQPSVSAPAPLDREVATSAPRSALRSRQPVRAAPARRWLSAHLLPRVPARKSFQQAAGGGNEDASISKPKNCDD